MSTSRGRVTPKKTCDQCGREREAEPGVFTILDGHNVCNWHPHFITAQRLDAVPFLTFQAKPIKDSRPFDPRSTFQLAEEQIFATLRDLYTFGRINVAASPADAAGAMPVNTSPALTNAKTSAWSAAWTGIYMHALIAEGKRPLWMIRDATTLLRSVAEFLLTRMEAGPSITTGMGRLGNDTIVNGDFQIAWGAYHLDASAFGILGVTAGETAAQPLGDYFVMPSAAAGIALLRAYQVFGDSRYLAGARACAWFLRTMQCGDLAPLGPSCADAALTIRKHWGTWASRITIIGSWAYHHRYMPQSLLCLRFLQLFLDIAGDEVIGSPLTSVDVPGGGGYIFTGSREARVSTCIAEARAFWSTAQPDSVLGTLVKGFSPETPADCYLPYAANLGLGAGLGAWAWTTLTAAGQDITSDNWAMGLSALYELDGASPDVIAIFDWLMSFTANPTELLPDGVDDSYKFVNPNQGTYDPTFALSLRLRVRSTASGPFDTKVNTPNLGLYSLNTTGLLAPLWSARQPAGFRAMKEALDLPRPQGVVSAASSIGVPLAATAGGRSFYLGPFGNCNLTLFPNVTPRVYPALAAMTGMIYRQQPQAFLGRGH